MATTSTESRSSLAPYIALLAVQFLFGSLPVVAKPVLPAIPALPLVGIRVGITALVLVGFQLFRRRLWLSTPGDYAKLAILSLFGVTLNQMLFIGGLSYTKASNASLLVVTIPIFTLAVSSIVGRDRLTVLKVLGIGLAAAGAIFLIDPRNASFSSETTIGDLMIILNSLAFGIYVACSKDVVTRNGTFRSMMWLFIFSAVVCVPIGAVTWGSQEVSAVTAPAWLAVVYIALFATAAPYLLNAFALSSVSPAAVTVFIYLQPLIGFILATIFLQESLDFRFGIAAALIFVGVFITTRRGHRKSEAKTNALPMT